MYNRIHCYINLEIFVITFIIFLIFLIKMKRRKKIKVGERERQRGAYN